MNPQMTIERSMRVKDNKITNCGCSNCEFSKASGYKSTDMRCPGNTMHGCSHFLTYDCYMRSHRCGKGGCVCTCLSCEDGLDSKIEDVIIKNSSKKKKIDIKTSRPMKIVVADFKAKQVELHEIIR